MKNKNIGSGTGLLIIIIFIISTVIIARLILNVDNNKNIKISNENNNLIQENKVVIDYNLSKLDQFLKYSKKEDINYIKNFNFKLKMINGLDGKTLKNDYKIISYKTIDADSSKQARYFRPNYEVELLDYKYRDPLMNEDASRCLIKKNGDDDSKSGWLNCGWIDIEKERKISSNQKNNIWYFYLKQYPYHIFNKKNFYHKIHYKIKKLDQDSVEVYENHTVYSDINKTKIIYQGNDILFSLLILDYYKSNNICQIEWKKLSDLEWEYKQGWIDCNYIEILEY